MHIKAFVGCWVLIFLGAVPPLFAGSMPTQAADSSRPRYRLIMDFPTTPNFRITRWTAPSRLLVDLQGSKPVGGVKQAIGAESLVSWIGFAPAKAKDDVRIRIDLKTAVDYKAFTDTYKNRPRLIIELAARPPAPTPANPRSKPLATALPAPVNPTTTARPGKTPATVKTASPTNKPERSAPPPKPFVVAIDAGHGGKDTGALGPNGTREKDVVMAIARKLSHFVHAEPGMKPVLVRRGDYFVDLRHRVAIARRAKADLFVSLHADAYVNDLAKGSSVFTLSDHGATSEAARWLADRENSYFVGGLKLKNKDKTLASVLLDLSQGATLEASDRAAGRVLRELKKDFHIHHHQVQKAGFAVLKSPDMPSMLIETAFISNPDEERNLCDSLHQEQIARAVFKGIRAYFADRRTPQPLALRMADAGDSADESGGNKLVAQK